MRFKNKHLGIVALFFIFNLLFFTLITTSVIYAGGGSSGGGSGDGGEDDAASPSKQKSFMDHLSDFFSSIGRVLGFVAGVALGVVTSGFGIAAAGAAVGLGSVGLTGKTPTEHAIDAVSSALNDATSPGATTPSLDAGTTPSTNPNANYAS